MWQNSYEKKSNLYLISTPIGNLDDITLRSINVLKEVEVVFSEDTRVTSLLLNHLQIKKKLIPLHEHNEDTAKEKVLSYLEQGFSVALVTDRGTPIISDPGYKTVKYIIEKGYNVIALPGACAFVPALITSGIEPEHFIFYGFLNSKKSKRKKELQELKNNKTTIIFYEAPHRIIETLNDIKNIFGDRNISISREITKKYESIFRGKITDFLSMENLIKGEFVIVVSGNKEVIEMQDKDLFQEIDDYIKNGFSKQEAIKKVANDNNISKNILYNDYHNRK